MLDSFIIFVVTNATILSALNNFSDLLQWAFDGGHLGLTSILTFLLLLMIGSTFAASFSIFIISGLRLMLITAFSPIIWLASLKYTEVLTQALKTGKMSLLRVLIFGLLCAVSLVMMSMGQAYLLGTLVISPIALKMMVTLFDSKESRV